MMEQHPIPQQITSYEFKLVGDMTLKQFLKAAAGIIIAILLNASSLVFFVKWPLMLFFAGAGLALAFLPYQDRPLETWLVAFIKSIYSPTIYIWKKRSVYNWLDINPNKKLPEEEKIEVPIKEETKINEFIQSLPSVKEGVNEEIKEEKESKTAAVLTEIKEEKQTQTVAADDNRSVAEKVYENWRNEDTTLNLKKEKLEATGNAVFGEIPMPDTPDTANVLVGMVTDQNGKIIPDAIVEIEDEQGNPSRVLRTNALGQFKSSTELANGNYLVATEKDDHKFDVVKINMKGEIVQPIKIQAIG